MAEKMRLDEQISAAPPQVRSLIENWQNKYGINLSSASQDATRAMEAALQRKTTAPVRQALFKVLAEQDPAQAIKLEIAAYRRKGETVSARTESNAILETGRIFGTPTEALAAYRKASAMLKDDIAGHAKQPAEKAEPGGEQRYSDTQLVARAVLTAYSANKQVGELHDKMTERRKELLDIYYPNGIKGTDMKTFQAVLDGDKDYSSMAGQFSSKTMIRDGMLEAIGINPRAVYLKCGEASNSAIGMLLQPLMMDVAASKDAGARKVLGEAGGAKNVEAAIARDTNKFMKELDVYQQSNGQIDFSALFKSQAEYTEWSLANERVRGKKTA